MGMHAASLSLALGGGKLRRKEGTHGRSFHLCCCVVENTAALAACSQVECRRWSHPVLVATVEAD